MDPTKSHQSKKSVRFHGFKVVSDFCSPFTELGKNYCIVHAVAPLKAKWVEIWAMLPCQATSGCRQRFPSYV